MFLRCDRGVAAAARRGLRAERDRRLTFESLEHRYVLNGTLDASFGTGGLTSLSFITEFDGQEINDIARQSDGKVVTVGAFRYLDTAKSAFGIAQFNADGTPDSRFGLNGRAVVKFTDSGEDIARGVAVQADGKIVVVGSSRAGEFGSTDFAVARLTAGGSLDTTFDGDGKMTRHLHDSAYDDWATSVAVQSDGKIVVAGTVVAFFDPDFGVMRLNPNGSLDTTFDTDGIVLTDFGPLSLPEDYARDVAIQSDGRIVVAGYTRPLGAGTGDFAVLRLNTNGSPDTTFDSDGQVTIDVDSDDQGEGVAIQSDGKMVVAGTADVGAGTNFGVVRLNANGTLDTTFHDDGIRTRNLGGQDYAFDVAVTSHGDIVVVGYTDSGGTNDFAAFVMEPDGTRNTHFGPGAIRSFDLGGDDRAHALVLTLDDRIVLGGYTTAGTPPSQFAVARVWTPDAQADKVGLRRGNQYILDVDGNGTWTPGVDRALNWGLASDTPLVGDFNGDGYDEIGLRRGDRFILDVDGNGTWTPGVDRALNWGLASDTPLVGDFNGDGYDEIGLRRGDRFILDVDGNGTWTPGVDRALNWGLASDTPLVGDWNGDGYDEIGLHRGTQFILDVDGNETWTPGVDRALNWGLASDTPLVGDWNGDGYDEIGLRRSTQFILDVDGNGTWTPGVDRAYYWGLAGDTPLIGNWEAAAPLLAACGPARIDSEAETLTKAAVAPILARAVEAYSALPLSTQQQTLLGQVTVRVEDLAGARLGQALGTTITLDVNAAGYGWFVDPTPWDDVEFDIPHSGSQLPHSDFRIPTSMDLLTAVMHEIGHVLGYGHDEGGVMQDTLSPGTRRSWDDLDPFPAESDALIDANAFEPALVDAAFGAELL